jgi:hypothetical protein
VRFDTEPVQQRVRAAGVPHAGVGLPGGGAQVAGGRELHPGQRVEQARLADPGGASQRHDRMVALVAGAQPEPGGRALDQILRLGQLVAAEPGLDRIGDSGHPPGG